MNKWIKTAMALAVVSLPAPSLATTVPTPEQLQSVRDRLPEDEVIYFLLPDRFENGDTKNDRGGLKGDRLVDRL